MNSRKADFPIFNTYPDLVYLDSAATSQKPQSVIEKVNFVYKSMNSNIHRGIYDLSQSATDAFEQSRAKMAEFIGASEPSEVIFTSSTTEGINFVAGGWAKSHLVKGDIIVLTDMEHHSNIVPWQRLRDEIGVEIYFIPLDEDFRLDYRRAKNLNMSKVKLLAITQASNVLGTITPVDEIMQYFKSMGANLKLLVDAAQSIPHMPLKVGKLNADFLVFSTHKMLGPSGVGVLYVRKDLLDEMAPLIVGSHMISSVTKEHTKWAESPDKFEPGTRNIEGTIASGTAVDYLESIGMDEIMEYEKSLTIYTLDRFKNCKNVRLFGSTTSRDRLGVFSFEVSRVHPHDVSEILNRSGVAVRAGHHCAQPLMKNLGVTGTVRASLYIYNDSSDVDKLFEAIEQTKKVFKV